MLLGPIASIFTNKYGCRKITIAGTLIAAFGFLISIFAPSITFMYFSFGIVAGKKLTTSLHLFLLHLLFLFFCLYFDRRKIYVLTWCVHLL